MSQPLGVEYWGGPHPEKITSCPNGYEWLAEECEYAPSTQGADSNVFGDALYTSMRWIYRLIHVEEVWTNEKDDAGKIVIRGLEMKRKSLCVVFGMPELIYLLLHLD